MRSFSSIMKILSLTRSTLLRINGLLTRTLQSLILTSQSLQPLYLRGNPTISTLNTSTRKRTSRLPSSISMPGLSTLLMECVLTSKCTQSIFQRMELVHQTTSPQSWVSSSTPRDTIQASLKQKLTSSTSSSTAFNSIS